MEIYKEPGSNGVVYCVFPKKYDKAEAIAETAKYRKKAKDTLKIIKVWVVGDELRFDPEGKDERIAVITG